MEKASEHTGKTACHPYDEWHKKEWLCSYNKDSGKEVKKLHGI